ncbi:putative serine esterase-domain-containing protein [Vararia minispora EC-137]|uniref:Serine esterase-domain-containing protein n=1 Tax=Vararia minispora EC-137 TaxID=1314806 RepID=A0ACB8QAV0_9AGAM|nr:putative serine esterase-domain-containing protein [Vararia minispora EC-137]
MTEGIHLVVLIHGMWGHPGNLAEAHSIFNEQRVQSAKKDSEGVQFRVLVAETNRDESTYDGIDWGGERVAKEVFEEIDKVKEEGGQVTRFSVLGYSLGGLVARYLVGIMHQKRMFETIKPVNFNTIATPHIGLLQYPTLFSRLASRFGPTLLSRTGEQFFGVDKWSQRGRPLIEVMADPERVFYQGLVLFEHIRIYANAINDRTVPYITSVIEYDDPFVDYKATGLQVELLEGYEPVIKSWTVPSEPPPPEPQPLPLSPAWFRSIRDQPLPLWLRRNYLQKSLSYNLLIIAILPVFFPTLIALGVTRLTLASRRSRERIQLLEKDDTPRLLSIVAELEREIEGFVLDTVENAGASPLAASPPLSSNESTELQPHKQSADPVKPSKSAPRLSAMQIRIIASLNAIPQLQKERAWIADVHNSHATIVARDVAGFPFHELGRGLLRHWADNFVA